MTLHFMFTKRTLGSLPCFTAQDPEVSLSFVIEANSDLSSVTLFRIPLTTPFS